MIVGRHHTPFNPHVQTGVRTDIIAARKVAPATDRSENQPVSPEAWITLATIALVFVGLVRNMGPPDALLLGGTVILGLTGVITPEEAFSGFINPGVLTIAALFVVAAAMRETGALDAIGANILGKARSERAALVRMVLPVTGMSAFLNNTPVVAMLVPILTDWCRKNRVSPSRLLIPLSYLAILGGTCTLIGTSTNLVVNGLMNNAVHHSPELAESLRPLGLFEVGRVGLPIAVVGALYVLFVGSRLLPDRKDLLERLGDASREYLIDMRVQPGCRLIGQEVEEAGLRHLQGLFLVEIVREERTISPVGPHETLQAGDILTFTGVVSTIVELERILGLVPVADENYAERGIDRRGKQLSEAVISATSPLIGTNIRDADFRALYNAAIIAVHRGGARLRGRVGDIVIQNGDTLLLQTGPHFTRAHRNNPDFYLVGGVEESRSVRHDRAALAVGFLIVLVALMTSGVVPKVMAAFLVAGLMVGSRCISAGVARQAIDWQTLIAIGAAFGLGNALEKTGCATLVADLVTQAAGAWGPYALLAAAYLATSILSETVTNRAAVILMFPVAVAIAGRLGVDPRPFVMAITYSAACSLVTPIGYQTNLMVYGPGGYRYSDYVRAGLPLNLILMTLVTILVPRVWGF